MSAELIARVRASVTDRADAHATQWGRIAIPYASTGITLNVNNLLSAADVLALCTTVETLTAERDAANAHIALLEGEGHTGCNERIAQLEAERDAALDGLASIRKLDPCALGDWLLIRAATTIQRVPLTGADT